MEETKKQFLTKAEPYRTMDIEKDCHSPRQFDESRKAKDIKQRGPE